jgi:DNA-binding beta-propeller fold protein YncE
LRVQPADTSEYCRKDSRSSETFRSPEGLRYNGHLKNAVTKAPDEFKAIAFRAPCYTTPVRETRSWAKCCAAVLAIAIAALARPSARSGIAQSQPSLPTFEVDPFWPKPLPNNWILGAVAGVAVDARDHVWITHRPSTLQPNETRSIWRAAPPVLEFDADGALVSSWGGPGSGYEWPQLEHGIFVDYRDRVWLGSGGEKDAQILAFTRDGKFLMQIGHQGKGRGSNDLENLGAPANMVVDRDGNELYVADGYVNHRVIVFDADSGRYKRHWGAYGRKPDDGFFERTGEKLPLPFSGAVQQENKPSQYDPNAPPAPQFRIVHAVRISHDGLVYVCDRTNNRIQVFQKDGTFVRELVIAKDTFGSGSVWDIGFSIDPRQTFLFVNDGTNQRVYIVEREPLRVVGEFGRAGHWAGQFYGAHNLAVNSKGDLFITETYEGKRVQKFRYAGLRRTQSGR